MSSHLHFLTHVNALRVNGAGGSIQYVEALKTGFEMRIDRTCQCNVSGFRKEKNGSVIMKLVSVDNLMKTRIAKRGNDRRERGKFKAEIEAGREVGKGWAK